ncbi:MAG: hypothetical protein VKL58_00080 [Cyanobacteriota bacterium]|nr:hypothetical protein [Cyanobacteriota bacterium]
MSNTPYSRSEGAPSPEGVNRDDLRSVLEGLQQDRLWLLRQLDSGRWPQWRLDLAALERELGQVLDQAGERLE